MCIRDRLQAVHAAFDQAERDGAIVILTGREGYFSAGFDLKVFAGGDVDRVIEMLTLGATLAERILGFQRPVITACPGHTVAAGAFMALAADLRIGTEGPFKIGLNAVSYTHLERGETFFLLGLGWRNTNSIFWIKIMKNRPKRLSPRGFATPASHRRSLTRAPSSARVQRRIGETMAETLRKTVTIAKQRFELRRDRIESCLLYTSACSARKLRASKRSPHSAWWRSPPRWA